MKSTHASVLLSALFLLPTFAFAADWSGNWQGTGKLMASDGYMDTCDSMTIALTETETTLTFAPVFTCVESGWTPEAMEFTKTADGKLQVGGTDIGTRTDTMIEFLADGLKVQMTLDADGNLAYADFFDYGDNLSDSYTGTLAKVAAPRCVQPSARPASKRPVSLR